MLFSNRGCRPLLYSPLDEAGNVLGEPCSFQLVQLVRVKVYMALTLALTLPFVLILLTCLVTLIRDLLRTRRLGSKTRFKILVLVILVCVFSTINFFDICGDKLGATGSFFAVWFLNLSLLNMGFVVIFESWVESIRDMHGIRIPNADTYHFLAELASVVFTWIYSIQYFSPLEEVKSLSAFALACILFGISLLTYSYLRQILRFYYASQNSGFARSRKLVVQRQIAFSVIICVLTILGGTAQVANSTLRITSPPQGSTAESIELQSFGFNTVNAVGLITCCLIVFLAFRTDQVDKNSTTVS